MGSSVALDATAKPGYRFAGWEGPVENGRLPITSVNVDGDTRIEALFVPE